MGKYHIFTKTSQLTSTDAIFTSTYHTKQLNPWPNSSASCVVNYSWLSACQEDMQPFEGNPSTHGRLKSCRNKPQQKQPGQILASILAWIFSQCVQLSFDDEKCVLLFSAWKPAFLKFAHIYSKGYNFYLWYQVLCSNNHSKNLYIHCWWYNTNRSPFQVSFLIHI